ncbi:MAG: hypothetical protein HQK83_13865 [Fibrobacteria bacterium]|nr:hypothetical protein [Fibrobacteria bacterium]
MESKVGKKIGEVHHTYPEKTIKLIVFDVILLSAITVLRSHVEIKWIYLDDFTKYDMCEADVKVLAMLV